MSEIEGGYKPMTPERFEEIARMEAEATEGPWWEDDRETTWTLHGVGWRTSQGEIVNKQLIKARKEDERFMPYWPGPLDSNFIVGARTAVPELLAEVRYLQTKLAALSMAADTEHGVVEDGFGSAWARCAPDCGLQVVRPGKAQCPCDPESADG